jgi:cytochrome c
MVLLGGWLLGGCAESGAGDGPTVSESMTKPATVDEQVADGQTLFAARCARCHGASGQGGAGPRLVGSGALAGFENAEQVAEFVQTNMPPGESRTLGPTADYAVVAFVLDSSGVTLGTRPLDVDVAGAVRVR